jgi:two-component system KDP operon response regulator KdpE
MTVKILIVEDDAAMLDALGRRLRREGFSVVMAENGLEGLRVFHTDHPDLVILDMVLPEMDGLTVCQRIREVSEAPVMILSAQAVTEEDIVEGLSTGADEYIVKPVRFNEFVARVKALLRRAQTNSAPTVSSYSDGYLSVDFQQHLVYINGEKVRLTPTEFKVLVVLLENAGRVVPQRELLERVWGAEYTNDTYYPRVYISQIRRKIEPDPANPIYILTEHRVGYRFEKRKKGLP